ncbi:PHO85 cyclin-1 [Coemansia sp. RSA 1646]|nr:PHO85 cyclin-1 [Coemansia sp. RSA 1646]
MSTPLNPRTLDTIQCEITKEMIAAIAMHARNVIPCTPAPVLTSPDRLSSAASAAVDPVCAQRSVRPGSAERLPSPPATPGAGTLSNIPPLDTFITNLVLRSRVQAGTLICTLVYLQRLRHRLPKEARGMECTCHRIFLAALIVAGKYLNDASPKNKYWARYSTMFTVAEVNLMEKQLLFLLDFDLRIDNEDLNEAASAFYPSNSKHAAPLTPTTPPFSASHSHPAGTEAAVADSSVSAQNKADNANTTNPAIVAYESLPQCQPSQKGIYPHVYPEPARFYPPTLGLGNHADSANHHIHKQSQKKPLLGHCPDRRMSHQPLPSAVDSSSMTNVSDLPNGSKHYNTAAHGESAGYPYTIKPHGRRHCTDNTKPQFSFDPKAVSQSLGYKQMSSSASTSSCEPTQQQTGLCSHGVYAQPGMAPLSSAGPLLQLSADEQLHLRPSPKKRAVSRGHYGNIPHPSPIYHHCPGSGAPSSSATAAPSTATSSSAYFLQPLEQAQSSYARSRYQQQRYDPGASRLASSRSAAPRMAMSIPSLRKYIHSDSPELAQTGIGSISTRRAQKERHILRHQSTAPDIGKVDSMISGPSSIPFSSSHVQYSRDRSVSSTHTSQPHHKLPANESNLPLRPPLARLASFGSCAMDTSPVHTLVYKESPAVSLGLASSNSYSQCLAGQAQLSSRVQEDLGDSNEHTLTAPPVTALSELSFDTHMHTSGDCISQQCHDDGSYLLPGVHGNSTASRGDSTCGGATHTRCGDSSNGDGEASNSSGSSSGWQLKTKILHPISTWFRLSRHQHSQQSPGGHKQHDIATPAPCTVEVDAGENGPIYAHNNINGTLSTDSKLSSKGASASPLATKRLRDRGFVDML